MKSALMLLGCTHHHDGADLLVTEGWEALLNGLGMVLEGRRPLLVRDPRPLVTDRLDRSRRPWDPRGRIRADEGSLGTASDAADAAETEARQRREHRRHGPIGRKRSLISQMRGLMMEPPTSPTVRG